MTETKKGYPVISFQTPGAWEDWLAKNHDRAQGVWIKMAKKASGFPSVSRQEALKVALCYGWIDGQADKVDDAWWLLKFTPRRKNSPWSKINIANIEALTEAGKMKPAGIKEVEAAKKDGRWDQAYDSPKEMSMPEDLLRELARNKKARDFFETLNKTNRFTIAYRLQTAKKPETRARRMEKILDMLTSGKKFY